MSPGILRLKLVLLAHGRRIAVLLAVAGLLSLLLAGVTYSQPQTETVTERAHVQTVATTVDSSAVVTGNSSLWDRGEQLVNQPFYPSAAPELTLTAKTTAPADRPVQISQRVTLIRQAVRDDSVIWQRKAVLVRNEDQVTDGEFSTTSTIDTRSLKTEVDRINEEVQGIGSGRVLVQLNVTYDTGRYQGRLSVQAPLVLASNGYWIAGELEDQRTHSTPITRQETVPPTRTSYLAPALAGLGLLGGAGLVRLFLRVGPEPTEVRDRLERVRYEEWISFGYLEGDLGERQVQLRSLGDLVDIGIDSDKRTIHDPDRGLFGVIDGDILYYYPTSELSFTPDESDGEWEWPFEEPLPEDPSQEFFSGTDQSEED